MKQVKLNAYQSGLALILSLLLLFILTLVAVASFSSSNVQERAAGNVRLQTMAFEAAAAGANNAIDFFLTQASASPSGVPDLDCGASDHVGWYDADDNPILTDWVEVDYPVGNVRLQQRMYCLTDEYPCTVGEPGCDTGIVRTPRSQLFVLSRGEVLNNDDVTVAFREVEVRIDRRTNVWTAEGCGAICFAACDFQLDRHDDPAIDFPSSNVFHVDGDDGPAVTTAAGCDNEPSLLDAITDDLQDSRLGNYVGGLHEQDPGEPWNDPTQTDIFREQVMQDAMDPLLGNLYVDEFYTPPESSSGYWSDGGYIDMGNTVYGTVDDPMITYVAGDLTMGGNISGAGIIMVEGNIAWNGTPDFKGLIVTLGGTYTIDGGGLGGNHAGTVVVLNNNGQTGCSADGGTCDPFGAISWQNTGGGNAEYNWDCDAVLNAFSMVDDSGFVDSEISDNPETPWGVDCDRGPPTLFETPAELVIASWRENLGWRTEEFSAP